VIAKAIDVLHAGGLRIVAERARQLRATSIVRRLHRRGDMVRVYDAKGERRKRKYRHKPQKPEAPHGSGVFQAPGYAPFRFSAYG